MKKKNSMTTTIMRKHTKKQIANLEEWELEKVDERRKGGVSL